MKRKSSKLTNLLPTRIGAFVEPWSTLSGTFDDKLQQGLRLLPQKARNLFAIDCAEKALPFFESYTRNNRLREILKETRQYVISSPWPIPLSNTAHVNEVYSMVRSLDEYEGEIKRRASMAARSALSAVNLWYSQNAVSQGEAAQYAILASQEDDWFRKLLNKTLGKELDEALRLSDLPELEGEPADVTQATIIRAQAYGKLREILDDLSSLKAGAKKKAEWCASQFQEQTGAYEWITPITLTYAAGVKSPLDALCRFRFLSAEEIIRFWGPLSLPKSGAPAPSKKNKNKIGADPDLIGVWPGSSEAERTRWGMALLHGVREVTGDMDWSLYEQPMIARAGEPGYTIQSIELEIAEDFWLTFSLTYPRIVDYMSRHNARNDWYVELEVSVGIAEQEADIELYKERRSVQTKQEREAAKQSLADPAYIMNKIKFKLRGAMDNARWSSTDRKALEHRKKVSDVLNPKFKGEPVRFSDSSYSDKPKVIGGKMSGNDTFSFQTYAREKNAKKDSKLFKRKKDAGAFLQYPQWVRVYPDGHLEVVYGGDGTQEKVWATYRDKAHINRTFDMKFDKDYVRVEAQTSVGAKPIGTKNLDKIPLNHDVIDGPMARLIHTLTPLQSLLNKFAAKWIQEQNAYIEGARDSWDQISNITFQAFPRIRTQAKLLITPVFPVVFELLEVMTYDGVGKSAIAKSAKAWKWFQEKQFSIGPSYAGAYESHSKDLNAEIEFAKTLIRRDDVTYQQLFQFLDKLRETLSMIYTREPSDEVGSKRTSASLVGAKTMGATVINHSIVDGPLAKVLETMKPLHNCLGKVSKAFNDELRGDKSKGSSNFSYYQISSRTISNFPNLKKELRSKIDSIFPSIFELLDTLSFDGVGKTNLTKVRGNWLWLQNEAFAPDRISAGIYNDVFFSLDVSMIEGEAILRIADSKYSTLYRWLNDLAETLSRINPKENTSEVGKTRAKTSTVGAATLKHIPLNHSVVDGPLAQVLVPLEALATYISTVGDYFNRLTFQPQYRAGSGDILRNLASDDTRKKFPTLERKTTALVQDIFPPLLHLLEVLAFEGIGKKLVKEFTKQYTEFKEKFEGVHHAYVGHFTAVNREIWKFVGVGQDLLRKPGANYEDLYAWIGNLMYPLSQVYHRRGPGMPDQVGWSEGGDDDGEETGRKIRELLKHMPVAIQTRWANDCLQHVLPEFERAFPGKNYLRKIIELRKEFASGKISNSVLLMSSPALFPFPEEGQDVLWHFYAAAMTPHPYEISQHAAEAVANAQNLGYAYDLERQWQLRRLQDYDNGTIAGKAASVGTKRKQPAPEWRGASPRLGQTVRTACPISEEASVCRNWNARMPEKGIIDYVTPTEIHLQGVVRPFTRRDNGSWVLKGYSVTDGPYLEPLHVNKTVGLRTR